MAANFNLTTPAAPANATNVTWQTDGSGNISAYLGNTTLTASNVDLLTQAANIGSTPLLTPSASGTFRISVYIIITQAGTTSTMPSVAIAWTDPDNSTGQTITATATSTANALTTYAQATVVIRAKTGNAINYSTASYASSGTTMQYALHIRTESLG